eukprot:gene11239-15080_t
MASLLLTPCPFLFSAILDGVPHRFILIIECESRIDDDPQMPNRFSVGAINATKDPRYASFKQLMEVGVKRDKSAIQIPSSWLMVHQYIYIINANTDEHGWQYRSQWPHATKSNKDEQWVNRPQQNSLVRRRIWMATIVPRHDLVRSKRLLSENLTQDSGQIKLEDELYRFEEGIIGKTGSNAWHKRRVVLYHNRLEFYTGNSKKGDFSLAECEVKILFESQCPGKKYAFSIRNPHGSVGILLDAGDKETRRRWVIGIQYQLALISSDFNFAPFEYGPPTGEYPDNRVFCCSDLAILNREKATWHERHMQLLPREIVWFDGEVMKGRIFVEKAVILDDANLTFALRSSSGILIPIRAESSEIKKLWMDNVRKQIVFIENQKLKLKTTPKEELNDSTITEVDRISEFYDESWNAPAVEGEDEDYLKLLFAAGSQNNPSSFEFSEFESGNESTLKRVGSGLDSLMSSGGSQSGSIAIRGASPNFTGNNSVMSGSAAAPPARSNSNNSIGGKKTSFSSDAVRAPSPSYHPKINFDALSELESRDKRAPQSTLPPPSLKPTKSFISNPPSVVKYIEPKRSLINPKFILAVLKGLRYRFVLVLECESRMSEKLGISPVTLPRFSVGGPRACRDPRTIPLNQLLGINNKRPEIQLPSGWLMLHQYIYVIQNNTDDNGWQYRSNWSESGIVGNSEEQWVDTCNDDKLVRRRLWMTTVVKKEDIIRAKKMVTENLNGVKGDCIMQGFLFRYNSYVNANMTNVWQKGRVLLFHNKLEFYVGNDRKGETLLENCEVKMLFGSQCPGRNYAFSIRNPNNTVSVLLDAESKESRRRWVHAINYQLAIISPDINYPPFDYGPPTGDFADNRVLLCGDLQKCSNQAKKWTTVHLQLKPKELLYYDRDVLKGRLFLDQAKIESKKDDDMEFTVKLASGYVLLLRADSMEEKLAWTRAIKRQASYIENLKQKKTSIPVEEQDVSGGGVISPSERYQYFFDDAWNAPPPDQDDVDYMLQLEYEAFRNNKELWEYEEEDAEESMAEMKQYDAIDRSLQFGGKYISDIKDNDQFRYTNFEKMPLFTPEHQSLMVKYLLPEVFELLNERTTSRSITLSNVILLGVAIPLTPIGVTAGDAESYDLFKELLYPIIRELHIGYNPDFQTQPPSNIDPSRISLSDAQKQMLIERASFTRISASRNFSNYSFLAGVTDTERNEIEHVSKELINLLSEIGEFQGDYYRLNALTEEQKNFVTECSNAFGVSLDRKMYSGSGSGSDRQWPKNRGLFVNFAKSVYIWVNDDDHLRLVTTDNGSDVVGVFNQFALLHESLEAVIANSGYAFSKNNSLGYLTSCPSNLGTALTISILVNLPQFYRLLTTSTQRDDIELLFDICNAFELRCVAPAGSGGITSLGGNNSNAKFDISNDQRLGTTESLTMQRVLDGITTCIEFDKMLEEGSSPSDIRQLIQEKLHEHRLKAAAISMKGHTRSIVTSTSVSMSTATATSVSASIHLSNNRVSVHTGLMKGIKGSYEDDKPLEQLTELTSKPTISSRSNRNNFLNPSLQPDAPDSFFNSPFGGADRFSPNGRQSSERGKQFSIKESDISATTTSIDTSRIAPKLGLSINSLRPTPLNTSRDINNNSSNNYSNNYDSGLTPKSGGYDPSSLRHIGSVPSTPTDAPKSSSGEFYRPPLRPTPSSRLANEMGNGTPSNSSTYNDPDGAQKQSSPYLQYKDMLKKRTPTKSEHINQQDDNKLDDDEATPRRGAGSMRRTSGGNYVLEKVNQIETEVEKKTMPNIPSTSSGGLRTPR